MALRAIQLPADLVPLGEMIIGAFQYPENEAWSVQVDEKEELVDAVRNLRRMWPLIHLIQSLSPGLRDILRGHVWEEDGKIVGTTLLQRRGSADLWTISTVGVLPAYRRGGIARKLVEAALETVRERGGTKAVLSVIDGNVPACALYEKVGFERYGGKIDFTLAPEGATAEPELPPGYTQSPLGSFDWRPRYELAEAILPESVRKYEPVTESRFRQPTTMRLLLPLILFAQGTRERELVLRTSREGGIVARGGSSIRTRGKGLSRLWIRLDPAHGGLAPYMVQYLLRVATTSNPGHRVELSVARWMDAVIAAAEVAGFDRRMEHHRMGIEL